MSIGSAMTMWNHRYDGHGTRWRFQGNKKLIILAGKQDIAGKGKVIERRAGRKGFGFWDPNACLCLWWGVSLVAGLLGGEVKVACRYGIGLRGFFKVFCSFLLTAWHYNILIT